MNPENAPIPDSVLPEFKGMDPLAEKPCIARSISALNPILYRSKRLKLFQLLEFVAFVTPTNTHNLDRRGFVQPVLSAMLA